MEDVARLALIASALQQASVRWWADHGTLLAIVREDRLFPWDQDIDLSIDVNHLKQASHALAALRPLLAARVIHTRRNVKVVPYHPDQKTVDISTYRHVDAHVMEKYFVMFPRTPRLALGRTRRFIWRRLRLIERILERGERWTSKRRSILAVVSVRVFGALTRTVTAARERLGVTRVSRVPNPYLATLSTLRWRGIDLPAPQPPEPYLEHRYGPDWRTPDPSWLWWQSDRSIAGNRNP